MQSSKAATITWDVTPGAIGVGDGLITDGAGTWNTVLGNWTADAGANNIAFTAGDDVIFGGGTVGAVGTISLGQAINANSIVFNPPNGGGAYTIAGGAGNFGLTLGAGGITANNAGNISANTILGAAQSWSNTSSGLLNVSGNVANGGNLLTLANSSTGETSLSGNISGAGGITVNSSGAGAVTLAGFNTHSGATTLTAGQLNINNGGSASTNSALGTGAFTIAGGSIDNTSGRLVVVQTTGAQNWNGNFTFLGSNYLNLGTGAVAMNASRTVTVNANTLQVGGIVSGAGFKLTKQGAGALTLSGASTFTGGAQLDAGILNVNAAAALGTAAGTFTIAGGVLDNTSGASVTTNAYPLALNGDFTFSGTSSLNLGAGAATLSANRVITVNTNSSTVAANTLTIGGVLAGAFNLSKAGEGNLTLSAANTFGGATKTVTLDAGTLTLGNAASLGNAANTLIINGGSLDVSGAVAMGNYPQNWNGDFRFLGANTLNLGAGAVTLSATRQVTVSASSLTVGGVISGAGFGLTKAGAGTMVLTGTSNAGYSGPTTINGGVLQLNVGTNGTTGRLNSASGLVLTGTSAFIMANVGETSASSSQSFAASSFTAGEGTIEINHTTAFNSTMTLASLSRSTGAIGLLAPGGSSAFVNGTSVKMSVTGQAANSIFAPGTFASVFTGAAPTVYNLAFNDSAGFVREINYATDTNAISQAGGDLLANATKEVRTTATATLSANAQLNSLDINSATAANLSLASGATLSLGNGSAPGVLLRNLGSTTTISGGDGITAGGGQELIIRADAAADAITLLTPIKATTGVVTKSGAGSLAFGTTGTTGVGGSNNFTGSLYVNAGTVTAVGADSLNSAVTQSIVLNGGTTLNLRTDGNGSGSRETVLFGDNYSMTGAGTVTLTADRQGLGQAGATTFLAAANKTIRLGDLSIGNQVLQVTPSNGFGIEFNGVTTLSSTPTFGVTTATASNLVQGLTLSGLVTGSTTLTGITKTGTGTLALTGTSNDFVGNITIAGGILSFVADGSLGNAANQITLNGTTATLRATAGTPGSPITTSRTINFSSATAANNVIEVAAGNALQLNAPFGLANNPWTKADRGLLIINADNSVKSSTVAVNLGALRASNNNALGIGTVTVNNIGSALQLAGSVTLNNNIILNANSNQFGGINSAGSLQSVSGINTLLGTVTQTSGTAAVVGADAGSTLNFLGTYLSPGTNSIGFTAGAGAAINWQVPIHNNGGVFKWGAGAFTLTAASPAYVNALTINGGAFNISGAGTLGITGAISAAPGSALNINDSIGTATVANRLGGRAVTLSGAALNYVGGGAGLPAPWTSNETAGVLTANAGMDTVRVTGGTALNPATLTFASLTGNAAGFLNLQGIDANNRVVLTTAATLVGGVIQRAALNGTDLATSTAASPIAVATYTAAAGDLNNVTGATGPGGTILVTANAELGSGSHQLATATGATLNAVVMHSGTAATLTGTAGNVLTLTSGNLLVSGSTGNVLGNSASPGNGIVLAQGAVASTLIVNTGASLELAGTVTTNANIGIQKALGGLLNITGKQFFNTGSANFDITGGTVKLSAGDNTLAAGLVNVAIDPTASLDLNGTSLTTNALLSPASSVNPLSGGNVINSNASQATLVVKGASTFGGQITGNIAVGIAATAILNNDNNYTGNTLITAGASVIRDYGKLSSPTGNIDINYGALHLFNDGMAADTDRINDAKAIVLRGGSISMKGRAVSFATETLGSVTAALGTSLIGSANQTGSESVLTINSLSRTASAGATLAFTPQFYNINGGTGGATADGGLGALGNNGRIDVAGGVPLTNNIIGPWAVGMGFFPATDMAEFASYAPNLGIGRLNTTGYAGYNGTALVSNQPTQNIRMVGTALTVPAGGSTVNSLNVANATTSTVALTFANGTDVLNLASGGLIVQNGIASAGATTIGTVALPGVITAGGAAPGAANDLYLYYFGSGSALTVNSKIANSIDSSPVRLVVWGGVSASNANVILANAANNYTGGTVVNQAALTIGATGNLPAGGLTLNGGSLTQTAGGVIASQAVTLNAGSTLTLAGDNSLPGITINNIGGTTAPTVNAGGILTLTDATPITVTSSNVLVGSTITGGALNFGATSKTVSVGAPMVNGKVVDPFQSALNIVSAISGSVTGVGLLKTGNGNLQLSSTTSTFDGGVNLSAGGLVIGSSSTPAIRPTAALQPYATSGPLGVGTLTIAGGTRILSSSSANAIVNPITVGGNFEFDGITSVTLNGDINLGGAARTISVNTPQMTATLGGVISNGTGLTKDGYGILILNNANTFTGGVTLNNGTLAAQLPANAASTTSPLGTGAVSYNGGILSLRSLAGDAIFGNAINVNAAVKYVNLDVQVAGGGQIAMGNLNLPMSAITGAGTAGVTGGPLVAQVNVTGSLGSILKFPTTSISGNGDGGTATTRTTGQFQTFNIGSGVTTILNDPFCRNNEPLNIGAGSLLLGGANCFINATSVLASGSGAAPLANASTAIYGAGQTVTLSGGTVGTPNTYSILPQTNSVIVGNTLGGLEQSSTITTAGVLNAAGAWGAGASSIMGAVQPNDAALDRIISVSTNSTLGVFNGYINITNAGDYKFLIGGDDYTALVIDGVEVARDIVSGQGVLDSARGTINLSSGQHAITFKLNTGAGTTIASPGGGGRLLYSGPDTVASGTNGSWQAVSASNLSYFTGPASAANNFYNAAQIDNDYALAAAAVYTLQGLGTDYNSTIKSLTMGIGSQLNAVNDLAATGVGGTGFLGVKGVTTLGTGAIVSPTTANLYLIGGISDTGNGLTKQGTGVLSLNNSSAFTGPFAIQAGTVVLREVNGLSTGTNTITSGASLDLYGVGSSAGRNLILNGVGTTSQIGALYNSQANAATFAGDINVATASTIAGFGDMSVSGAVSSAAGITLTKGGPDTLTLSASNTASLLGPIAITGGVLNNGNLNAGTAGALGVNTISVGGSTTLNLNGNNLAATQTVTANGGTLNNLGPNATTNGNIINSSISSSYTQRNAVAPGSNMLQLANTANTATIASGIVLNTATVGIGSNTYATGGDILVTGIISGNQALAKRGGDTLFLEGSNTFTNSLFVDYGTIKLQGAGVLNGSSATNGFIAVQAGGTFTIDNVGTFTNNRVNANAVGSNRSLSLNGGIVNILGNSNAANDTTELFSASVVAGNVGGITANSGHSYLNLTPNATGGSVVLTAARAGTSQDITSANSGTMLITARNLGIGLAADGNANIQLTNALTTAGLNIIGQNSNTANGGANGIVTKGIAPWLVVDNGSSVNFATVDSVASVGLRGLATGGGAAEYVAGNTNTLVANNNTLITANTVAPVNVTTNLNSIKLTGGTLTLSAGSNLNIQSGGVLATANATIDGPGIITTSGTPVASTTAASQTLYLWSHGLGTTLTINAAIGGANANGGQIGEVVKAGAGTVVLGGANFMVNNTRVQEGTLKINNASAIYFRNPNANAFNAFNSSVVGPTLQVNGGGVVDINGFDLTVNNLNSINPAGTANSMSGGMVTNTASLKNFTINLTGSNSWNGVIAGNLNFARYGRDTFTVNNSNTYTGSTIIGGAANTLVDLGALRNTSSIAINAATLIWNDNGTQSDPWRLGAVPAPITMNGGGFQYTGRQGESSTANLGAVTLNSGSNQFTTNAQNFAHATIQLGSLNRVGNATLNFGGSILGDDGNVKVTDGVPNYNGIVGGWAITTTPNPYVSATSPSYGDFVSYDAATGFRAIVDYKTTGGLSYAGSDANQPALGNSVFGAGNNIRVNSTTTMLPGNNIANSMVIGTNATTTLAFANPTDTLFIQSGGILASGDNNNKNIGGVTAPVAANLNGYLTSGNANGSAGAGNPNYELFIHNIGNGTTAILAVNSQIIDNGANPVSLIVTQGNQNSPLTRFNNTNTYTGPTTVQSADLRLNSLTGPAIANSLNITIVGGNENAADSSRQANNRILFEQNNQLNAAANVTISSGSANLDLNNFNQTLGNIAFNNIGGFTANANGIGPSVRTGAGVLTLTGGITATNLKNSSDISFVAGNVLLPSGQHTVAVDTVGPAPAMIGLNLSAAISGAGGINKTGLGVLSMTGVNDYTGPTNVLNGTLVLAGVSSGDSNTDLSMIAGGSRFSVSTGATIDLRGGNAIIGSLAGAGSVTNSVQAIINNPSTGNSAALTIGADNTSGANFSGVFTNFINGISEASGFLLNVTKIGSGNQILSGNNAASIFPAGSNGSVNNVGTLDIQDGAITVSGAAGTLGFTTINLKTGATLAVDNSTNLVANRLGGHLLADNNNDIAATIIRTINMQGGTVNFIQGAALTNEGGAGPLAIVGNRGVGTVNLNIGASTWNFTGGTGGATMNLNALTAGAGTLYINAGATQTLGQTLAGASSINIYVNGGMIGQGGGAISTGAAVAAAAGLSSNFSGIGIRPDVTATDSSGTGFVTYDVFGYRLLKTTEYDAFPTQPLHPMETGTLLTPTNPLANWAAVNPTINPPTYSGNSLVAATQSLTTNTTVSSLRLDAAGSVVSHGGNLLIANCPVQDWNALGTLNTLTVSSGTIIGNTGNLGLTGGAVTAGGNALRFTTTGNTDLNAYGFSTGTGNAFVKEGAGDLNVMKRTFIGSATDVGATVVNGGTLNLLAGPNTLTVIEGTGATNTDNLFINVGTVDLKGNSQTVATLVSTDITPGGGGVLTNTGALANFYIAQPNNTSATFGGSINGAINLFRTWNGGPANTPNYTLSSTNGYTGSTTIQGGILVLQDSGTLASTTYNINGGQLRYENRAPGLSEIVQRTPAAATYNMNGGTFMDLGRATANQVTQTFSTVNSLQNLNELRTDSGLGDNRTLVITNLNMSAGSQMHFNTGSGTLGGVGNNPNIVIGNFNAGTMTINGVIPWAVAQIDQPAMYNTAINPITGMAYGVSVPNNNGTANFAGTFTTAVTNNNVNQAGSATASSEAAVTTSRVFNSLRFSSTQATVLNSARQETVRLEAGLIITSQGNLNLNNGFLTAGTTAGVSQSLYTHINSATFAFNGQIINNGAGVTSLIKSGGGALTLVPGVATGGSQTGAATNATVVGSTVITLSAAMTTPPIVGNKVYGPGIPNGATVVSVSGATVTISAPAFATTNVGAFGFGDAQVLTGTNATVASGAAGFTTLTLSTAQAQTLYVGANLQSAGMSANITAIDTATGIVTLGAWTASAAVGANTAISYGTASQINTNSAYTGSTIVNGNSGSIAGTQLGGALNLNGVLGTRALGSNTSLTINNGGVVAMNAAGNIAPNTDVIINGGGSLTFSPVTLVEPTSGGLNAINSLTFNNNGGGIVPTLAGGASGIVTVKNGLITSNSDNQGTTPVVSGVLNFGQVGLGSWASGVTTVTVGDVAGYLAGQTVSGTGIAPGTTISSITGNVITLSAATTASSAATGSLLAAVNQASGSSAVMTPTLNVTTTDLAEVTGDLNITAVIANSPSWVAITGAPLTKTGNGTVILTGANTFNNGFAHNAGTVMVANAAAFGTGTLTIASGTTLLGDAAASLANRTFTNPVTVNGDFTFGGRQANNGLVMSGNVALGAVSRTITVTNPTVTATIGGIISNTAGGLIKAGDGILALNGANTYSGTTSINAGLVVLGATATLGATTNDLVVKCNAALNLSGRSTSIDGLTGDNAIMGGLITNSGITASLTIGSNNEASAVFAGSITDTAGLINIVKSGTGTQVLNGANTYHGTTTISAGNLIVNGSVANTAVTVAAGGTLGGAGFIGNTFGGSVTASTATSVIDLSLLTNGTTSSTGAAVGNTTTLSISGVAGTDGLVIGNGATLKLDATTTATDSIALLNGTKLNQTGTAFNVQMNQLTGTLADGVYNLITFNTGNSNLVNIGNTLDVGDGVLTGTLALGWRLFGAATALQLIKGDNILYWNGDVSNAWNVTGANTNWSDLTGATDSLIIPGAADTVVFASQAGANMSTTLGQSFSINALQFGTGNNNTVGAIPSSASIDTGANTLTLNAGGITQAAGSLANTLTGTGGVNLLASQAWTNNSSTNLTVSAPISGGAAAGLVINGLGTGAVVLSGVNTYTGGTVVGNTTFGTLSTSTLQLGSSTALGAATNVLTVNANGVVDLNGNSIATAGIAGNKGTITNTSATPATLTFTPVASSSYSGNINGNTAVAKTGAGTGIIANPTFTATTTAASATVTLTNGATTAGLVVGQVITDNANIPAGTTIASIISATQFTLSTSVGVTAGTSIATAFPLAASTYSGGTSISNGILQLGTGVAGSMGVTGVAAGMAQGALGTGTVSITNSATLVLDAGDTDKYNTANSFSIDNGSIVNGTVAATADGAQHLATGAGATIAIGAGGAVFNAQGTVVANATNTNDLYLHGQLTGTSQINIGAGTSRVHVENGTNTFSGAFINGGNLDVDNTTALATASVINNGAGLRFGATTSNAEITTSLTSATFGSLAGTGAFALQNFAAAALTLTVGGNNTSTTYSGIVSGAGSLNKVGSGEMTLSGTNTFTGAVTVAQGTVLIGNAAALGTTAGTTTLNSAATGASNTALLTQGAFTTAENITVAALGTGLSSLGGNTNNASIFSGTVALAKDTILTQVATSGTNGVSFNGVISGAGAITKTGDGLVAITNANTYTGNTIVNAGVLQVGAGGTAAARDNGTTGATSTTLTVNAGGTVIGTGTVSGIAGTNHLLNGILNPGDVNVLSGSIAGDNTGLGTLNITGNLTATALGSALNFQAQGATTTDTSVITGINNGTAPIGSAAYLAALIAAATTAEAGATNSTAGSHDFLNGSGTLTLGSTSNVSLRFTSGFVSAGGMFFDLMDWASMVTTGFNNGGTANGLTSTRDGGLIGNLDLPTLSAGQLWDVSQFNTTGVVFIVAPEPSRVLLALLGLLGLTLRRRRRTA